MRKLLLVLFLVHGCGAHAGWDFQPVQKFDDSARDAIAWDEPKVAAFVSDVGLMSAYLMPPVLMLDEHHRDKKILAFAGVHAVNLTLTNLVKVQAGRLRPNAENYRSFFSGHTSAVFTSAGFLCSIGNSRECLGGLGVATVTGYMRIAAKKHWLTDVITGAVVGFSVGSAAPVFIRAF